VKRYLHLVIMELHRFWKIYAALAALTVLSQTAGLWWSIRTLMKRVHWEMELTNLSSYAEFANQYGRISFMSAVSIKEPFFTGSVAVCVTALLLYVFLIWYRDWYGKNTFIYRLLMLPGSRLNLFWAKLTTILLLSWGLVALQIVLFPPLMAMYRHMVPEELALDTSVFSFVRHHPVFDLLMPPHAADFLLHYWLGITGVAVVFTAILMERSFRLKGLAAGALYALVSGLLIIGPVSFEHVLYPSEIFGLTVALSVLLFVLSVWISGMLLKRKISV